MSCNRLTYNGRWVPGRQKMALVPTTCDAAWRGAVRSRRAAPAEGSVAHTGEPRSIYTALTAGQPLTELGAVVESATWLGESARYSLPCAFLAQWFLKHYSSEDESRARRLECVTRAGDLLYVPRG